MTDPNEQDCALQILNRADKSKFTQAAAPDPKFRMAPCSAPD